MSDEILHEISCPNCLQPINIREHGQHVVCDACGSQFIIEGHICPECSAYHREEQDFCRECGSPITRVCRKCQTRNWAGAEYCQRCGAAMDIFDLLAMKNRQVSQDANVERREMIRKLKEEEALASEKRMQEMMAAEEQRLAKERKRRVAQAEKEKRMMLTLAGIIGLFIILLVIFIFLRMLF